MITLAFSTEFYHGFTTAMLLALLISKSIRLLFRWLDRREERIDQETSDNDPKP